MRKRAATIVRKIAHATGASRRWALTREEERILFIHGVGDADYPAAAFRAQLAYLKNHFRVVSLSEIVSEKARGGRGTAGAIALTFDDGLRCHYHVVYPALLELELPATFYVCPGLIDRGAWLWNHNLRARLLSIPHARLDPLLRELEAPSMDVLQAMAWMKTLSPERLQPIERGIVDATHGFVPTEFEREAYDPMTWEEVRSMNPDLITIGSHTVNHAILPSLAPDQMRHEMIDSRKQIESKLDRPVEHFSYPDGQWNDGAVRLAEETYRSAATARGGFVRPGDSVHRLPRIAMPRTLPSLSWKLHRPRA
jgi:peptidoglycan/xylan/chitin deacetylase (PgdA/CDA1 family)